MSVARFAKNLIATAVVSLCVRAQSPVVVYEDSTNYTGKFNQSLNEYGDEIILLGNAHFITQFQFEYVGNFTPQGDERARLRFYANTGPAWMGNHDYLTPAATPLWETVIPISPGFNTATIPVPYIDVPLRFTWTIQFFGVTMTSTDNAGLLFYGKPIIGSSFNDYWELLTSGWQPERYSDIPNNNFAAKVMAVAAAPAPPAISISTSGGNLNISWPVGLTSMYLESKPAVSEGIWAPVLPQAIRVGDNFQATIPITAGNRVFRLNSQPKPPLSVTAIAGSVQLRWSAAIGGQKIQMKSSLADTNWTDVPTPTRPTGDYYEATIPTATAGNAFYRLTRAQ